MFDFFIFIFNNEIYNIDKNKKQQQQQSHFQWKQGGVTTKNLKQDRKKAFYGKIFILARFLFC
jgi:hypothetical protein